MAHKAFTDVVTELANSSWGREYENDKQAEQDLMKTVDLSGACLLGLVKRFDRVIHALTNDAMQVEIRKIQTNANQSITRFIESIESIHGPCPDDVKQYVIETMEAEIGAKLRCGWRCDGCKHWFPAPAKGTDVRRSWDKWKRKKLK